MLRLMEVLLHAGTKVVGWRTAEIHQALLSAFHLTPERYSLTQLRYDLRKMKAHGLLQRDGRPYAYTLTEQGTRAALLFVLFHKRVCGPLANSLFHRPVPSAKPLSKLEAAYHKADPLHRPSYSTPRCLMTSKSQTNILRPRFQES